jgi:predicted branched-subunit amino acid permease
MPGSATAIPGRRAARSDYARGVRDIAPIVAATIPFGLVFGAIASHDGLALDDSVLLSALTFAGASQFAALEFWAHPLPFLTILLSVMAVNLRLVLYSAAIARRIGHWSAPARYLGLGLLSDPIYALAELNGGARISPAYYFGLAVPLYINWIVTTAAGFLFGNLIRNPEAVGLDFLVIAYFIHLLAGFRTRPNALAVIGASAAGSVLAYVMAGSPWHFAGGAAAGVLVAAALAKPDRVAA